MKVMTSSTGYLNPKRARRGSAMDSSQKPSHSKTLRPGNPTSSSPTTPPTSPQKWPARNFQLGDLLPSRSNSRMTESLPVTSPKSTDAESSQTSIGLTDQMRQLSSFREKAQERSGSSKPKAPKPQS